MFFAKWFDENSIECVIASAYASGKGRLFEMFFGWRESHAGSSKFVFSRKDWENIYVEINYYHEFIEKSEKNA